MLYQESGSLAGRGLRIRAQIVRVVVEKGVLYGGVEVRV